MSCCNNIIERTTRLSPACPFCREHFTRSTVRLIRNDFNRPSSGWSTPRRSPNSLRPPLIEDDFAYDRPSPQGFGATLPCSYVPNIASPLSCPGHSCSTSVTPTRSVSVAPTSPTCLASIGPTRISTPGLPSSTHRSATPGPTSYRSTTPALPSPTCKSRTMLMSQQQPPPLPSGDRWPASLIAAASKPSAPSAALRLLGPRVPTRA